jgi:hypothetical protein
MKIVDSRDEPGVPIASLTVGRWFVANLGLFLKASDDVIVDIGSGRRIPFDETQIVQSVEVSVTIERNRD